MYVGTACLMPTQTDLLPAIVDYVPVIDGLLLALRQAVPRYFRDN